MLIASVAFTIMHALVKQMDTFHVTQLLFFRSSVTALLCLFYLRLIKVSPWGNNRPLLALRAIVGLISLGMFFITIQRMPLGAAVSIRYLAPIFTAILAPIFLKERVTWAQYALFLVAITGVFILKGFDTRVDSIGLILGLVGALSGGLVYVLLGKMKGLEHPLVIIFYFMSLTMIVSGSLMSPYWRQPTIDEWGILLAIGAIGCLAQIFMTSAFQKGKASDVSFIKYVEIVNSLLIGLIWFGESYSTLSMLGLALILVSIPLALYLSKAKKKVDQ